MIDQRFYPATDVVDWEPLARHLAPLSADGWMFMYADTDGWRHYKDYETRIYISVNVDGRWDTR